MALQLPASAAPAGAEASQKTPVQRPKRRRTGVTRYEHWFYLAPALIVLLALMAYPLYQLINVSLYNYGQAQISGNAALEFIGLGNYITLFSDAEFWQVLVNTVIFAAACVILTLGLGSALAVLATRLRPWVRSTLFAVSLGAWATPAVTGSAVWLFLFDPTQGLVNKVLAGVGMSGFADHSWTYEKWSAFGLVASEVVWCSFPFVMVTVYAGIQAIPTEVVEAARLDGASMPRIFTNIMLPMLRPIVIIVTIQSIIWNFKVFSQIYIMTNGGGIAGQNMVLNVYGYQQAFAASLYGLGSALGVIMTVILLIVTIVYLRLLRRNGEVL